MPLTHWSPSSAAEGRRGLTARAAWSYNRRMQEVTVRIPAPLRPFADGQAELSVAVGTVGELIDSIGERHPQLPPRLLTPEGELRPYVNVFIDKANIRGLEGLATPVSAGSVVRIIPAVGGG